MRITDISKLNCFLVAAAKTRIGRSLWNLFEIYTVLDMYSPFLLLQPRDLENDTKSVHSYDEGSLAAGQTYQV